MLLSRAKLIRAVAFDVDGVMTDGGLYLSDSGDEFKRFNSLDGQGIKMLRDSGFEVAIIKLVDDLSHFLAFRREPDANRPAVGARALQKM